MRNSVRAFLALCCSIGTCFAQTQTARNPAEPGAARPVVSWPAGYIDPGTPRPPYVAPETPQGTGPFSAVMATEPGASEFVLYYPADLARLGRQKMPILLWANGSCAYTGNNFRYFLTEIASHGYFAVAGGTMGRPANETVSMSQNPIVRKPGEPAPPPAAPRGGDASRKRVTISLIGQGIDWAIAENTRQGSKFFGRLDTSKIAVMGMSCGGVVALGAGTDPRVSTVGIWNSGSTMIPGERDAASENLKKLHTPVLYISGDGDLDIGRIPAQADFDQINTLPVFYGWEDHLAHLGTYRQSNGGELAPVAIAWLDWRLKSDKKAAKMFQGVDCTLCRRPGWHVQKKRIDGN